MKKIFTKLIGVTLGLAMAVGVGVGVANNLNKDAALLDAASSAMGSYVKVTTADGISAGDTVIMVNQTGTRALQSISTTSTKYGTLYSLQNGEYDSSTNTITLNGRDVEELTVEAGNSSGSFSFKGNSNIFDNYLTWTSGNSLNKTTTKSDNSSWTLSVSSNNLVIANKNTAERLIRWNNDRFACYTTDTGTTAQLYKKQANVAVTGISVSPTSVELGVGATQQLTPTVLPNNATNKNVTYSSDASGIASVSESGLITAVSAGNATITVTTVDGNKTATCEVTVTAPISVTGVTLNKSETSIEIGSSETLVATIAPNNASNKSVTWTSSDDDVATVSGGVVSAEGIGEATITATTVDGGFTATCDVTVTAPTSVTFIAGTDIGTSSGQNEDTITKSGISMHCTSMHDSGSAYRFYASSTLTFTSTIGKMSSIEFTGNDGSNKISNISTTVSTGTVTVDANANTASWSGNANTISFTLTAQGRASQIVITMTPTTPALSLDKNTLDLKTNEPDGKQVTATVVNVDNPQFVWTFDDELINVVQESKVDGVQVVSIKPVTDEAVVSTTATLAITGTTLTASVTVSISIPEKGETAGTAFTVPEARAHIDSVITGGEATGNDGKTYYATGIVSEIVTSLNPTYGNITYNISVDGEKSSVQLQAYRGLGVGGAAFEDEDDIYIGDQVVVCGQLKKHNSTYEFDANNQLVSRVQAPKVNSISLTPSTVVVPTDDSGDVLDLFTNIVINQEVGSNKTANDIVWSSDDELVLAVADGEYVSCSTHRSSTTIRAYLNGKEYGHAAINVMDPDISYISYDVPEEWKLVGDISTLTAGDQVILTGVLDDEVYAAGTYSGTGNNVPAVTDPTLEAVGDTVTGVLDSMVYTLEEGAVSGSVAFKDSTGKYLYAAGGTSSNHMKTQNVIDENASFILNSDGTVVAQGSSTRNYMRYNNANGNNLFSCYGSTSTTGDLVTFYKLNGGSGELDLLSLTPIRAAYEDENEAYVRLGASLSEDDWDAMDSAFGIAGYGVMLIRGTTLEGTGFDTIEELYNSSDSVNKAKLTNLGKDSDAAPQDFSITAKISITKDSNRSVVFCAATYVKASDGTIYFINETSGSLVGLL